MDSRPIGVFDSGFGGVSVLASAALRLPRERFIFLGDNLHAPYGDRTPEEVLAYTRQGVERLTGMGCKAIVIACNTATSAAAAALRRELPLPVIGMEPALKPASLLPREGAVLVMATTMTLRLDKFHLLMERFGQNAVPVPCPGLVELIEAGETDGPRIRRKLTELLSPHLTGPVKAVVLGCTHYVFLRRALQALLPADVALVDGNEGTARQLERELIRCDLLAHPGTPSGAIADRPATQGCFAPPEARDALEDRIRFLSTAPDQAIPARMKAWYERALPEATAAEKGEAV